jgi:prepilin-type processing-associated H-X9-DG protein
MGPAKPTPIDLRNQGASLAELLVVVAVLSVLASLLAPVLAGARRAADTASCVARARQTVAAWLLYAGDSDDRCCPSYYTADRGRTIVAWDFAVRGQGPSTVSLGLLGPYTSTGSLYQCPSFQGESWGRPFTGYAYNTTYLGGDPAMGLWPAAMTEVADPAGTAAFADAGFGSPVRGHNFLRAPSDPLFVAGKVHFRHEGTANIAWADGRIRGSRAVHLPEVDEPLVGAVSPDDSAYDLD